MSTDQSLKAEVRATIDDFFRALDTQDLSLMKEVVAQDDEMIHVGTDTGEIWRGWDVLRSATEEQFETLESYEAEIRDLSVRVSPSGDIAWYFHLLDANITSGGSTRTWEGARFTGVLADEDGQWKMVQTHVSLPESA